MTFCYSVLKLSTPADLSVYTPVCLPAADADFTGRIIILHNYLVSLLTDISARVPLFIKIKIPLGYT
jgi:hypothetical protein